VQEEFFKNAKNLRIILKPHKPPRITVPFRIPFKTAEDFIHSKIFWIKENIEKEGLKAKLAVFLIGEDEASKAAAQTVLNESLLIYLKLLHPFMPFISEKVWRIFNNDSEVLMSTAWPTP